MKRIDTFPYAGEADMLECRLTELDKVIDRFVIVEADVTHGGNTPKPYHFLDQRDRFAPWADRIVYVQATDMPSLEDAWSRELAQREWIFSGLKDAAPDDIIFHGDVDEIPTEMAVRTTRPGGRNPTFVVIPQRFHPFAVDWYHEGGWNGTVAARLASIDSFSWMRNERLLHEANPAHAGLLPVPNRFGGWHFSWVSDGVEAKQAKIESFCHPEIAPNWVGHLGECYTGGLHVDGKRLEPVDVDSSWPKWIVAGNAPEGWYRPKGERQEPPPIGAVMAYGPMDKGYEYKPAGEAEDGWDVVGRAGDGVLMQRAL